MLLVALSCLQGRSQSDAFDALASLPVDGIQLTPGNLPSLGFRERVARYTGALRFHHSFSWQHYRGQVYDASGKPPPLPRAWSIHPPSARHPVGFGGWLEAALQVDALCEVMYPGQLLGSDDELREAMLSGLRLAVDISHVHIQRCRGDLGDATLARLLAYPRIEEVHVSHNAGQADSHLPLRAETRWLSWARERAQSGLPMIYESRMHEHTARWLEQLEMLR